MATKAKQQDVRVPVAKTYKIYIDGKFPRTESGRYYPLTDSHDAVIANVCRSSRKDFRNAVVAAYPKLSHRYYELKRKWLGLDTMQVWDRNAPLPMEDKRTVGWEQAEKMVMDAYNAFDPRMGEIAEPFFRKGWIDAGVKPGKAPGAFAHPTVTNVHPYVMLNYLGKPRDVMTLAHELGHGVHQRLDAGQGGAAHGKGMQDQTHRHELADAEAILAAMGAVDLGQAVARRQTV